MSDTSLNVVTYMERARRANSPENWANKVYAFASSFWGVGIWGLLGLAGVLYQRLYSLGVDSWVATATPVFVMGALLIAVLAQILRLNPAHWRRYSMFHALQRYPVFCSVSWDDIKSIRNADPCAEFELAILERDGKALGAVLFQVVDDVRTLPLHSSQSGVPDFPDEWKQGWPIRIFDGAVRPVYLQDGPHFSAPKVSV